MMKMRRVLAALLAVLTILAAPGVLQTAQAADTKASVSHAATKAYKVKVTASMLNIRKSADNKSNIVGLLKKGNTVTITAEKKDSRGVVWGKTDKGWINLDFTQKVKTGVNYSGKVNVPSLNVRKSADNTSKVIKVLKKGAKVTIVDEKKDSRGIVWGKLSDGSGWINLDFIKAEKKVSYKVVVTASKIYVRQYASISSGSVGTLKKGATVSVVAEQKDSRGITWVKLSNGKGWISLEGAKKTDSAPKSYKVKVTAYTLTIRKSAKASSAAVGYLKQNTTVTIVEEHRYSNGSAWGKLSDGRGWISLKYTKKA